MAAKAFVYYYCYATLPVDLRISQPTAIADAVASPQKRYIINRVGEIFKLGHPCWPGTLLSIALAPKAALAASSVNMRRGWLTQSTAIPCPSPYQDIK